MSRAAHLMAALVALSLISVVGVAGMTTGSDDFESDRCGFGAPVVSEGSYSGSFDDADDDASANVRLYEDQPVTITLDTVSETDSGDIFVHDEADRDGSTIEYEVRGEENINVDRGVLKGLQSDAPAQFQLWPQEDGYACIQLTADGESEEEWNVTIERQGSDVALKDVDELESAVVSLENDLHAEQQKTAELEDEIDDLETEVADLESEISTLEADKADLEDEIDDLKDSHDSEVADLEAEIDDLEEEISSLQAEKADLESEIETLQTDLEDQNQTIDELNKMIDNKDDIIAEQDDTISEQNDTIAEQDNTIAEQNDTIADLEQTIAEQNETIDELQSDDKSDDEKKGDDTGDDDRTPGFALGATALALIAAVLVLRRL
ncbi:hypothetical protein OB905_13020 [Halobacteria archaeon AArc-dxtr1]|nr:hypothetical protein [Halobacteria archaeon AArc-dxtr1]